MTVSVGHMPLGHGILAATREAEHSGTEKVEHRQLNRPATGHRIHGEDDGQMSHEDGNPAR